jgi:GGDEF domain-containing protein
MAAEKERREESTPRPRRFSRVRSTIRHGTSLHGKLVVLVLVITLSVVGALFLFSWTSLISSISAIYESRARAVATVISRSIQDKDYVLYYSESLDAEIGRMLERYTSVVGITVIGRSARGFLAVASTDPTQVGRLADEATQLRYESLDAVKVERVRTGDTPYLRAHHPIFSGADLVGIVLVDLSLDEQAMYVSRLAVRYGLGTLVGILVLGGLLSLALRAIVTQPIATIARAMGEISRSRYGQEVSLPLSRVPGAPQRDEISKLVDGYNLMTRVIRSHEQELLKLVVLDEETGAYTVGHFRRELERELLKTSRYKHPTSLLLVQLEGLDRLSPEIRGDGLVRTAGFLVRSLRTVDSLFRITDDRFVTLLPETPSEGAAAAARRLESLSPNLLLETEDRFSITIIPMGWEEGGTPPLDAIMDRLLGSLGDMLE